jgi:hypothetical protein
MDIKFFEIINILEINDMIKSLQDDQIEKILGISRAKIKF